uniref:Uncharacterized protein n=1 Tax=Cacopsylla melanoneura TaxID=428564 RepID=A0A8D8RCP9_9HEMI
MVELIGESLQVAQNACVRFVCNLRKYDHVSECYSQLKWYKLNKRRDINVLLLLLKVLNEAGPDYLRSDFRFLTSPRLELNTKTLDIPSHRTQAFNKSFVVRAARIWNSLPAKIRTSSTVECFKISSKRVFCLTR